MTVRGRDVVTSHGHVICFLQWMKKLTIDWHDLDVIWHDLRPVWHDLEAIWHHLRSPVAISPVFEHSKMAAHP